jgi:hypothetical protein
LFAGIRPVTEGQEYLLAQANDIAGTQGDRAGDAGIIHPGAIAAAQVFYQVRATSLAESCVVAGDTVVVDDNGVVGLPTKCDNITL